MNELERKFTLQDKNGYLDNKEIIDYLKNNKNLYIVLANGGMGKSYLAEKWSEELEYKIIKAQIVKEKDIKNNLIIDNLDEVSLEKSKKIITWITRKTISNKNIDNIIIFLRPERFFPKNLFIKINFLNQGNKNPRYEFDFQIKKKSYNEFEKYFLETLKIDEIEFDFLSILSFKLMSLGVININKYDLIEFIRKYNVNNSSSIRISSLEKKEIFKKFENDEIFFVSKTIPSFFVIGFLKKFAHIKYSYLTKFKNFSSQISFKETSQIILNMGNEGIKLIWNLIKNNNFFFMFLQWNQWEKAIGLDQFFEYGAKSTTKKELTKKLAQIQIICSNDKDFNRSIYFALKSKTLSKKIDFNEYISLINYGIKKSSKKYSSTLMFLNNFKNQCIENKNLYNQKIKSIENNANIIKKQIKENGIKKFEPTLYSLDFIKLKDILNNTYSIFGPIENAISFMITCEKFEKAIDLIENCLKKGKILFFNQKINLDKFTNFVIKEKSIDKTIKVLSITNFNTKKNGLLIKKIGIKNIFKYIFSLENKQKEINLGEKIKIENDLYNKIENDLYNKMKKWNLSNCLDVFEKIFSTNEIKEIKKEDIEIKNIGLSELKNDIFSIIKGKNVEYMNIMTKYDNSQSFSFPYNSQSFFEYYIIKKLIIPKNNKKLINTIASNFYKKLKILLEKRKNNIYILIKIIDFVLQVILQLDNEFFNKNKFHPLIIFVANGIKEQRKNNCNKFDNNEWNKWYNKIKMNVANKIIIKYLNDYEILKWIIIQKKDEWIWEYIEKIIEKMNKKNTNEVIKLLDKYAINEDLKYEFFSNYYNKIPETKKAIKKMKWIPKNFFECISIYNKGKIKAWTLIDDKYKEKIKEHISNHFKQNFIMLENHKNNLYSTKWNWYNGFFSNTIEENTIKKTIDFLWKENLIKYYFDKLKYFVNKKIKDDKKYIKNVIPTFFDWMISISYVETQISPKEEIEEIKKIILKKYPKDSENLEWIKKVWFNKIGKLIDSKEIKNVFNISNYYKYLNDDLTIIEFKNLFKERIIPEILKMAINILKKDKFETKLQKEISSKLSKKLIEEHGVILQRESNTYNINNTSRIDFILSKNDKYLFIELKTSKSINSNKLDEQLINYNDSYNLIHKKLLVIIEIHKLKNKTKEKIIQKANANEFEVLFIKKIIKNKIIKKLIDYFS